MRRYSHTIIALIACFGISVAHAATTYQYVGNNFSSFTENDPPPGMYTSAMSVTGSFTVNSALDPMSFTNIGASIVAYSFSDGRNTLTESNSSINNVTVAVDGSGQITFWNVVLETAALAQVGDIQFRIQSDNVGNAQDLGEISVCVLFTGSCTATSDIGRAPINPGSWSTVPVPAAVWLFGSALGLLGWIRRRQY